MTNEKAIMCLEDMKIKVPIPKAAKQARENNEALDVAIKALQSAEPKRGSWISADAIFGGVPFYCSECGENTRDTVMGKPRWNFCPNCGAKMEWTT